MRVLVADDERIMADTIAKGLRRRAMAVDVCYDGDSALERVTTNSYDVVILDRDLPVMHGDEVCRRIVASGGETRVLMLTAAAGIRDRVDGLLSNAIKYNLPGGWLETEVRPGTDAPGGRLVVRNTGAPVPAEAVPVLFEPFRRLGADRVAGNGGVGLGLAIVRSIVTAHHGNLQARPGQPGGLEITIDLPGKQGTGE